MIELLTSLMPSRSIPNCEGESYHLQFRHILRKKKKTRNTLSRHEIRRTQHAMQYKNVPSPKLRQSTSSGAVHYQVGLQLTAISSNRADLGNLACCCMLQTCEF